LRVDASPAVLDVAKVKPSRIRARGDEVHVSRVSARSGDRCMPLRAQARNCLIKFLGL
jgi:hypothetical protein